MFHRITVATSNFLIKSVNAIKFSNTPNLTPQSSAFRKYSTPSQCPPEKLEKVEFAEFQNLIKDQNVVIIDVREPEELVQHGSLPRSINVPLGEIESALKTMSNNEFFKKYGHTKPSKDAPIIFSCMRGFRSEEAQITALRLDYKNVKNYIGGWTDWAEKTKQNNGQKC